MNKTWWHVLFLIIKCNVILIPTPFFLEFISILFRFSSCHVRLCVIVILTFICDSIKSDCRRQSRMSRKSTEFGFLNWFCSHSAETAIIFVLILSLVIKCTVLEIKQIKKYNCSKKTLCTLYIRVVVTFFLCELCCNLAWNQSPLYCRFSLL